MLIGQSLLSAPARLNRDCRTTPTARKQAAIPIRSVICLVLQGFVHVGQVTCITMLQSPLHIHSSSSASQSSSHTSADDAWQLLTGHHNGEVKVWAASQGRPLHPLLVLAPAATSPIKSLVMLGDQLLCCAHANGRLTLCITSSSAQGVVSVNSQQALPTVKLQHAVYQAHVKGLSQCVKCEVGLMSVGSSGTILMWSTDQIKSMLEQGGVHLQARLVSAPKVHHCLAVT